MSKKDFIRLAEMIGKLQRMKDKGSNAGMLLSILPDMVVDAYRDSNPNFDAARFLARIKKTRLARIKKTRSE